MIVYASGRRGGYRRAGSDPRVAPPSQDGAGSPRGSILNPSATGSRLQPVTSEVTKQLITSCCSRICCSPESFVTKSFWRPSRTQHRMHRRMQFRSNTLRIEHTSSHSLERRPGRRHARRSRASSCPGSRRRQPRPAHAAMQRRRGGVGAAVLEGAGHRHAQLERPRSTGDWFQRSRRDALSASAPEAPQGSQHCSHGALHDPHATAYMALASL